MQGLHVTADLSGCRDPAGLMRDGAALAALCEQLATDTGLTVVGRQFHAFAPQGDAGITGVLLLAESHLAVHTWPELRAVTLDGHPVWVKRGDVHAQTPDDVVAVSPARVREAIEDELRGGNPKLASIARRLAMSPRTLQRRLREKGIFFNDVLDAARFRAAKSYLARNGVIESLTNSRYWAQQKGRRPGPFFVNLVMEGENKPLADLIASTERGLLVPVVRDADRKSLQQIAAETARLRRNCHRLIWLNPNQNYQGTAHLLQKDIIRLTQVGGIGRQADRKINLRLRFGRKPGGKTRLVLGELLGKLAAEFDVDGVRVGGQPLQQVVRIINEQTRQPVENPADKVFRENRIVELANHTALVAKDGREVRIEDSAAPVRQLRPHLRVVVPEQPQRVAHVEKEPAPRAEGPGDGLDDPFVLPLGLEEPEARIHVHDPVELVLEGDRPHVGMDEPDLEALLRRPGPRDVERPLGQVEARHAEPETSQRPAVPAHAAAQVEDVRPRLGAEDAGDERDLLGRVLVGDLEEEPLQPGLPEERLVPRCAVHRRDSIARPSPPLAAVAGAAGAQQQPRGQGGEQHAQAVHASGSGRLYLPIPKSSYSGQAGNTFAIPLPPGQAWPKLPPEGLQSDAEITKLPGVRVIGSPDATPGPSAEGCKREKAGRDAPCHPSTTTQRIKHHAGVCRRDQEQDYPCVPCRGQFQS